MTDKRELQKTVDGLQEALAKAQSELAALDKSELRHGDYGYYAGAEVTPKNMRFFIENEDGEVRHYEGRPNKIDPFDCGPRDSYVILGNLVDDLASHSKPLEEFEVWAWSNKDWTFSAKIHCGGVKLACKDWCFNTDQATEIHRNLGRLIATAKRKAAKT